MLATIKPRYHAPTAQNGHVASSGSRPRHHANSVAECQAHQPAHFGTSVAAWAPRLASRSSLKGGNVPLGSGALLGEWNGSTIATFPPAIPELRNSVSVELINNIFIS